MTIRRLKIRELEAIQTKLFSMIKNSYILSFPKMNIDDRYVMQQLQNLKDHLEKKDAIVFIAECDGQIAGFIWCHEIIRIQEKRLHISHFCVLEQYRNKGVGTLLMKEAKEYARVNKYSGIDLIVTATNSNAVRFYEQNEFSIERYLMNFHMGSDRTD